VHRERDRTFSLQVSWAIAHSRLPPRLKQLGLTMALAADSATGRSSWSQQRIAELMSVGRRTVQRYEKELDEYTDSPFRIERTVRGKGGGGFENVWTLVLTERGRHLVAPPTDRRVAPPNGDAGATIGASDPRRSLAPITDHGSAKIGRTVASPAGARSSADRRDRRQQKQRAADLDRAELTPRERRAFEALTADTTFAEMVQYPAELARELCAERTDLDVFATIANAGRWCREHREKRPRHARNFPRFLLNWFRRERRGRNVQRDDGFDLEAKAARDADDTS
jgi:hypothetical protein